jgi:hypothetical protein
VSALGYVPEVPWNNTCTNPLVLSNLVALAGEVSYTGTKVSDAETGCEFIATDSIYVFNNYTSNGEPADISGYVDTIGGGGGTSGCTTSDGSSASSCSGGHPKPSWQTGVTGIPSGSHRYLPDVSFFAANGFLGSAYLICVSTNGACVTSTAVGSEPYLQEIGGTSVSTPAMAGVMALINQSAKSAQGSPNAELYTLAGNQNYSSCSAETVTSGSTSCYFNDIDAGSGTDPNTISMPCDYGAPDGGISYATGSATLVAQQPGIKSPDCTPTHSGDTVGILPGVNAGTGYDLATGLGSLNVANVVNAWPASTAPAFSVSGTSVTVNQGATTGNTSTITVTPVNAFTGTVAFTCAVTTVPSGATSPVTCTPPSSLDVTGTTAVTTTTPLTIVSKANTTAGAYAVTVTGKSGSLSETGVVNVTVVNPNATFTISAGAPSPASVSPGGTAVSNVTLTAVDGYSGTVTFACAQTSGPSNAASDTPICAFTNSAVGMGSTTPFSVETLPVVASSELTWPGSNGKGRGSQRQQWLGAGSGAVLALLVFLGIPARRRSWRSMLSVLVALAVLGSLAACTSGGGTKNPGNPGTAAGTYVFTVTGTGDPAITPAPTATFTVVVN